MLGTHSKKIAYPLTLLIGAGVLGFLLFGKPEPESRPLEAAPVPLVDFVAVREQALPLSIYSQGVITASKRINVVAEVSGRVTEVNKNFAVGASFAKDEPLLVIDDTDFRAALSQAQAAVAEAKKLLATERGAARQAKREWRELNSTEANDLFLRKPQIASAEAQLRASESSLAKAKADLARTTISLPFDGKMLSKNVDLGEYIVTGRTIAEAFALENAELRLPLSTDQLYKLGDPVGAPVVVTSTSSTGQHQWLGEIERVEASVDPVSRLHHVVARLDNPFERLDSTLNLDRPALALGQFVEAVIQTAHRHSVYAIPRIALRQPQDVWVLDSENKMLVLPVELLQRDSDMALVQFNDASLQKLSERGLPSEDGLRIVTSDLSLVSSGMQVEVQQEQSKDGDATKQYHFEELPAE